MLLLDTNVVIGYVRADDSSLVRWLDRQRTEDQRLALSVLSVTELLSYEDAPIQEVIAIEQLLLFCKIIEVDITVARQAAELRKEYRIQVVDSVIAATAMLYQTSLVSRDKDFRKIAELELIVP